MKKTLRTLAIILSLAMLIGCLCGCTGAAGSLILATNNDVEQDASDLVGSWLDLEDDYLTFNADGTCDYFGTPCEGYTFDGAILTFSVEGEEFTLGARLFEDDLVLFLEGNTYDRVSGTEGELVGEWTANDDSGYSFTFTEDKFVEDETYSGTYSTDNEEVIMIYDDDNTYSYGLYNISDDELTFYFGWPLSRVTE